MKKTFIIIVLLTSFLNCNNDWEYQEKNILPKDYVLNINYKSTSSSVDLVEYDVNFNNDSGNILGDYPKNEIKKYGWKNTKWKTSSEYESQKIVSFIEDILDDNSLLLNDSEKSLLKKIKKAPSYYYTEFYKESSLVSNSHSYFDWNILWLLNLDSKKMYLISKAER